MWLMSPLSWFLLAAVLACTAAWVVRWRRRLLLCSATVGAISILAMTPLVANTLLGRIEAGYAVPSGCATSQPRIAIVLAGGVTGTASDPGDFSVLELASRRRVDGAAAWWRAGRGRRLVMSGGSWSGSGVPESDLMASYARRLGVPGAAISEERTSLTTWESAWHLSRLRPELPRRVVLITSAAHMRRAQYAMHAAGFRTCPLAVDRRYASFRFPGYFIPQRSALEKTETSLHEVVGLLYYRWLKLTAGWRAHGGNA